MDAEAVDYQREYDNSGRVSNSTELLNAYITDAAAFRESIGENADYDLTYGPNPRNKLDIFWPGEDRSCPIAMFIHGGYWQRLDRSAFSHMASGLTKSGIAVALPSYTLCPDISIDGIITEMRRACILLHQTYGRDLTVIGHSAGGHLAACMMATDWPSIHPELPEDLVAAGMGISGIYDLAPLLHTTVNDALKLNTVSAKQSSPVFWLPDGYHRFEAWVGGDESSEFHRQSHELSRKWSMLGTPTRYVSLPETNHFSVIHSLTDHSSEMVQTILELISNPLAEGTVPEAEEADIAANLQNFMFEPREKPKTESESTKPRKRSKPKAEVKVESKRKTKAPRKPKSK